MLLCRPKRRTAAYSSDSSGYESEASEGEQLSYAERRRRARRAGRFGDGLAHGAPGGRAAGAGAGASGEDRRQRLLSLLEEGDAEDIDWDSFAIKVRS